VAEWRYTVTKTDTPHLVPLSRQSVEIPERTAPSDRQGRCVFPSVRTPIGDRSMSDNAILAALQLMGVDKEERPPMASGPLARTGRNEPTWIVRRVPCRMLSWLFA
jgi:integrase